jgi:hypothetical protein
VAPRPQAVSAVLLAASVIRAYWWLALGKAMMGSEMSWFLRIQKKVSMAFFGTVFSGELEKWSYNYGKVFNVGSEKIAKGTNGFHVCGFLHP